MSNILIIKHGSLGDIVQISGILKDIKKHHKNDKIFMLTTLHYVELLSACPYIDAVLLDKRMPKWNILYLLKLKKLIRKYNFFKVYDLQNSSRTRFYRKILFKIKNWNSSDTVLEKGEKKRNYDKDPVLERFKFQLNKTSIETENTLNPDFSWACNNVDNIINKYLGKKFILIFPFSSASLKHKRWPYYEELIKIIRNNHNHIEIVIAPGPNEIEEAKNFDALSITNNKKSLNIMELAGLIIKSKFIITNDTGPAHMSAHLGMEGVVLFGYHTAPKKVSIETKNFKAITSDNLTDLNAKDVYNKIKDRIDLIN